MSSAFPDEQLLTAKDVSHILRIHVDTVRRYIRQRELPAAKVGRSYLVARQDLEDFIQERSTMNQPS